MNRIGIAVAMFAAVAGVTTRGEHFQGPPAPAPVVFDSLSGPEVFRYFCAPCHGYDGRGGGPVAGALKTRPANLTEIARRGHGAFSKARVEAFVTNGAAAGKNPAHGTAEMPVWGPTFWSIDLSDARLKVRIGNIVDYLESLQSETTLVSGTLTHHLLTNDLFQVDGLWMQVAPGTEFHRWLDGGVGHVVTVRLLRQPNPPPDARGVRVLPGHLIHDLAPAQIPAVHIVLLRDALTGSFGPMTLQTEDPAMARKFTFYEKDAVTNLVIEIK